MRRPHDFFYHFYMMKKILAFVLIVCLVPRMALSAAAPCADASKCPTNSICSNSYCFACSGTYNTANKSVLNGMGACYYDKDITLGSQKVYSDPNKVPAETKCVNYAHVFPVGTSGNAVTACECDEHYEKNSSKNQCDPNVYKIVLHYSPSASDTRYVKYGVGFGTSLTGNFSDEISIPKRIKNKYTFGGYYTGENGTGAQVFDKDNKAVVSSPTTYFEGNTDLYANWIPDFSIKYMVKNTSGTEACSLTESCTRSNDCKVVKTLSGISSQCSEQQIQSAQPSKIFQNWSCGGQVVQAGQEDMSWISSATINEKTIECVAQFRDCLAGYYCVTNGKEEACPRGTTSDKGATANTKCYISNQTVFVDAVGSFTLPVSSQVYYH